MRKTGPATPEGKKRVSRNAWKHGILSDHMVIPDVETPREWEAHRDGIFESCQPEGHLEHMLAERIAIQLWKLRRLEIYHMGKVRRAISGFAPHFDTSEKVTRRYLSKGPRNAFPDVNPGDPPELVTSLAEMVIPNGWELPTMIRYEAHLHRQLLQTMHELEAVQERRKGNPLNLARIDIIGAPADTR